MAFETWFNDYLLKVRSNTHKVSLQKWYDEVYIGELVSYTNRYVSELREEKKAAASPKEVLKIEAKMANVFKRLHKAEEESKTNLTQQLQEQERRYNEKTAKRLASSLMRALAEPVVADNDDEQPQQNCRMAHMTSG